MGRNRDDLCVNNNTRNDKIDIKFNLQIRKKDILDCEIFGIVMIRINICHVLVMYSLTVATTKMSLSLLHYISTL